MSEYKRTDKFGENKIEIKFGYVFVNGQPYSEHMIRGQRIFKKENKRHVEIIQRKAEEISDKIKDSLDSKKVLMEALMKRAFDGDIERLHKNLFDGKRKLKPTTREHHCVDMKIGNFILPIVE